MPKKKKEVKKVEIVESIDEIEEFEEPQYEEITIETEEKKAYRDLIEKYKTVNPEKYAQKEEELLTKLNKIK